MGLKELILNIYAEYPNSSPLDVCSMIESLVDVERGLIMGEICMMREVTEELVVTGNDDRGVLLSLA